uniref:ATP synthase F0 subunit 8 n=3 Tax=Endocoelantheae TaxID=86629 RepID=A0A0U2E4B9_9CNID|nr:ATP synthase F0 subunit 8 [Halcurias pilatus]AKQ50961.1 ATP synthase F0 subunit 8 [Isactinernus quadrilobatus]AKQ51016.1 ATP synthase F0 subunit 8 [Synhalcurias elegans]
MPQLETATYLTQYRWTLIALFFLFSFLVTSVLPTIKTNFLIRRSVVGSLAEAPKMSDLNKGPALLWSQALKHYGKI